MNPKRRAKPARTKTVSYRLETELRAAVTSAAQSMGLSDGAFVREAVLEKLGRSRVRGEALSEVHEEVRRLRADLALAAEAILTVSGGGEPARPAAAAWVRNNLNR